MAEMKKVYDDLIIINLYQLQIPTRFSDFPMTLRSTRHFINITQERQLLAHFGTLSSKTAHTSTQRGNQQEPKLIEKTTKITKLPKARLASSCLLHTFNISLIGYQKNCFGI